MDATYAKALMIWGSSGLSEDGGRWTYQRCTRDYSIGIENHRVSGHIFNTGCRRKKREIHALSKLGNHFHAGYFDALEKVVANQNYLVYGYESRQQCFGD